MEACRIIIEVYKNITIIDKKTTNKILKLVKECIKNEPIKFLAKKYEKIGIKKQVKS